MANARLLTHTTCANSINYKLDEAKSCAEQEKRREKKNLETKKKNVSAKLRKVATNERVRAPYHLTFCNQKSFKIIQQRAEEKEEGNNNNSQHTQPINGQ